MVSGRVLSKLWPRKLAMLRIDWTDLGRRETTETRGVRSNLETKFVWSVHWMLSSDSSSLSGSCSCGTRMDSQRSVSRNLRIFSGLPSVCSSMAWSNSGDTLVLVVLCGWILLREQQQHPEETNFGRIVVFGAFKQLWMVWVWVLRGVGNRKNVEWRCFDVFGMRHPDRMI